MAQAITPPNRGKAGDARFAVTGFVAGSFIDFGGLNFYPAWDVALPFGAIAYGLFLISFMLEKEATKFDEDAAKKLQLIRASRLAPAPRRKPATEPIILPVPTEKFGH